MTVATQEKVVESEPEQPALLGVHRSIRNQRWVERLVDVASLRAIAIAQQNNLPEILGRVLAARGAEPHAVESFLNPTLRALLPDPSAMRDMDRAAERFARAIADGERIALFGDYDVDGAASVALVVRFLRHHGRDAEIYIPDRLTEGYGPSETAMQALAQQGATLILTLDCGTGAHAAIAAANAAGAEVIVLDHHQAGETLPPACAVVNPNREDDLSGQGHLAAAGVVFVFLVAALRALRAASHYHDGLEPDLLSLLDLVALATVCDVVPLQGVNRAFVAQGLKIARLRQNVGLRALADIARLDEAPSTFSFGYILGPRINAGGRTGFSGLGAALLSTDDPLEAARLAERLHLLNEERKAIEERTLEEAVAAAEAVLLRDPDAPLLCLSGKGWHKGLVGLVASRLTDRFQRPSLVIGFDRDGVGTGSARSIPGIDLGRAIRDCVEQELLLRGGGHAMAAGFSIQREKLAAFEGHLREVFGAGFAASGASRTLKLDGTLSAGGATLDLLALLERAGPYGTGHPIPRFAFPHHRLTRVRLIKDAHIRATLLAPDGARIEACAFRAAGTALGQMLLASEDKQVHLAGHLKRNVWQERASVELIVDDAAAPERS